MEVSTELITPAAGMPNTSVVNTTSADRLQEEYWELAVAKFLYAVPSIVLLVLGTVGNTLSFIVFSGQNMRHSVTSVYFRVLAVSDTLVLFSGGLVFFVLGAFDIDIRLVSRASCKFWIPALVAFCYQSCWILVFIATDRFIGVWMPHKYRKLCTQKLAIISNVILFLVVTLTVGVFWMVVLDLNSEGSACSITGSYLPFFVNVFQWIDLTVLNLIPTIALVALNICIIIKIWRAAIQRKKTMSTHNANPPKKAGSTTAILLSVSLVYILCTIPSSTAFLVKRAFGNSDHAKAQVLLYVRSCETLYLANHAVNFILYCVHGSRFRKELARLFRKSKIKHSSSGTNSTGLSAIRRPKYTKREDI